MDDKTRLVIFDCGDSAGTCAVYPRCECGKYLKHGSVLINGLDQVKLVGWICKKHGEVTPSYEFVDPADLIPAR